MLCLKGSLKLLGDSGLPSLIRPPLCYGGWRGIRHVLSLGLSQSPGCSTTARRHIYLSIPSSPSQLAVLAVYALHTCTLHALSESCTSCCTPCVHLGPEQPLPATWSSLRFLEPSPYSIWVNQSSSVPGSVCCAFVPILWGLALIGS